MPSGHSSLLCAVMLVVNTLASSPIGCNHATMGVHAMAIDVCLPDGDNSQKIVCSDDGEGYVRTWALNTDCEGNHAFEAAVSDQGMEAVCDADPCHLAVFENYDDEAGSCDYDSTPAVAVYIIDECLAVGSSQSMVISCTGSQDAMISYYDNDEEHECSGTATMTATANDILSDGGCGSIVACDVVAGDEAEDSEASDSEASEESNGSSESTEESSESSGSSAVSNCNHAVFDGEGVLVEDFCASWLDDGISRMLQCRNDAPYLRTWHQSDSCDGAYEEEALTDYDGAEVVCDADPCQIVVFEIYDDGSDSGDSSESGESGESIDWDTSYDAGTTSEPTTEPTNEPTTEPTTEPTQADRRRLQQSSTCDMTSMVQIQPVILDTCFPSGDTESLLFSCTGTHDAMVQRFVDDADHECSGSAETTTTVSELQSEYCVTMIACNVNPGEDYAPNAAPTAAPTQHDGAHVTYGGAFTSMLIAAALLLNF